MGDYCEVEGKGKGLQWGPWLGVPVAQPCHDYDIDVEEWLHPTGSHIYVSHHAADLSNIWLVDFVENQFNIELVFGELYSQWKRATCFQSSVNKRMAHPAYLQIIGLGKPALPLIFKALREEPDHWFGALEAITRENPLPNAQNMSQLRDAWLVWAAAHGY